MPAGHVRLSAAGQSRPLAATEAAVVLCLVVVCACVGVDVVVTYVRELGVLFRLTWQCKRDPNHPKQIKHHVIAVSVLCYSELRASSSSFEFREGASRIIRLWLLV